ncbi:coordinator of PRMT5 and differentiation stimulator-like [Elgaria multicarinata webbii]|uniref:coordinator of PRMT5 and differentiation stimulator-like n=1 Tax=Elgaria multicarinata webbii TaxID=159646 RepID=UPI002FCD2498
MVTNTSKARVDGSSFAREKEVEMAKKVKIFSWSPGKGLAESMVEKVTSPLKDSDDLESDLGDCELDGEGCSMPTNTAFPEMKTTTQYEEEDWDKELAESENNNNPYGFEDVMHCGSFLDQNPAALCPIQDKPLYNPSLHHVAPLTLSRLEAMPVDGQFDDAVD